MVHCIGCVILGLALGVALTLITTIIVALDKLEEYIYWKQ